MADRCLRVIPLSCCSSTASAYLCQSTSRASLNSWTPRSPPRREITGCSTVQFRIVRAMAELLELPEAPSAGHVIAFDLQSVSLDLSSMPLDEVLDFRYTAHGQYA